MSEAIQIALAVAVVWTLVSVILGLWLGGGVRAERHGRRLMPRHWRPMMDSLLWTQRREQDKAVREVVKGALSKREVAQRLYEHSTFWRGWK